MEPTIQSIQRKILNRNKWTYSLGGIGRDMIYQLIATFFFTYVQYSGLNINAQQFSVIGILLVIGRVWDAVNDPIMGSIVENTRSKWGKFKPWILLGAVLTAIVVLFMFNFRPTGWGFVIFFGVIYLLWEAAFTLNDIPYWSLLPALAKTKKDRDQMAMLVVVFAAVGAILANIIVSLTTVGNMVRGYAMISVTFVIFFLACTFLTVFGVKEDKADQEEQPENVSIKQMFRVIAKNDQLLWSALALMLYSVGSGLLTALGYNFFYMNLGYDGSTITMFLLVYFVGSIVVQSFYAKLAKKFTRKKLSLLSLGVLAVGYFIILLFGYVPFLPATLATAMVFGFLVSSGQSIFYLVIIISITNTIEYNEYKTGNRNEAIVFSLRPFVAKFSSALQQGVVTLVLVATGVFALSQNVSELEKQKNVFDNLTAAQQVLYKADILARQTILDNVDLPDEAIHLLYDVMADPTLVSYEDPDGNGVQSMVINAAANRVFRDEVSLPMQLGMRFGIAILPLLLIGGAYLVMKKKYIIDEAYFEQITELAKEKRAASA
jgi:melibiose permease/lactose/raffinose/galactose permease